MKNILSLLIIAVFVSGSALAQDELQDPKAKSILDKVSEKAQGFSTIKASFSYTLSSEKDGTDETQEGSFIKKGNKYKVSMLGTDIYFNGTKRYTHIIDADECQITKPEPGDDDIMNPNYIFNFYKKGFKYKLKGEETIKGEIVNKIELFPENPKDKQYFKIELNIEKNTNHIHSMKYFGKDGTSYTIKIKKFTTNEPADDKMFFFDCDAMENKDVECIDMTED